MIRVLACVPAVCALLCVPASADTHRRLAGTRLEQEAARVLEEQAASVRCDEQHFIFGVGQADGSGMERIFFVAGGGDRPVVKIEFLGEVPPPYAQPGPAADLPAMAFVMELSAPRVLHATPDGDGWQISDGGWETALRFKYTSWYGDIWRAGGTWQIDWRGYRRPMLPRSVTANREKICAMFSGR